jgi:hypothetical protein
MRVMADVFVVGMAMLVTALSIWLSNDEDQK